MKKLLILSLLLPACNNIKVEHTTPQSKEEEFHFSFGSLLGDEGGITLFGGSKPKAASAYACVNGYLWQASLQALSFMPLVSTDATGGVIVTDWYVIPQTPQYRLKVTVYIVGRELRADNLKVKIIKQKQQGCNWVETIVNTCIARELEDIILTRARELRVKQKEK